MKQITILGSTGSIGRQSLDVIDRNSDRFGVFALVCGSNVKLLEEQIEKFKPALAVCKNEEDAKLLQDKFPNTEILWGEEGINKAVTGDCDLVLNSLVGMMGMVPTYHGIMAGKDIALANKETLVAGGEVIMRAVKEKGVNLTPIDSEHSAIFQCLRGQRSEDVTRLILTGSGGPFRTSTMEELKAATVEQALNHPNWSMGNKITIDSATLMNKGLEFIEAKWLFDFEPEKIEVVIHPQSIVHSMIETKDGAILAQMGVPDMKLPIAYALTCPERVESGSERLDLFGEGANLTFEKPDLDKFPCLRMAMEAIKAGGTYPAALNGANEELVAAFLDSRIGFMDIPGIIEKVIEEHKVQRDLSIDVILEADYLAREAAKKLMGEL